MIKAQVYYIAALLIPFQEIFNRIARLFEGSSRAVVALAIIGLLTVTVITIVVIWRLLNRHIHKVLFFFIVQLIFVVAYLIYHPIYANQAFKFKLSFIIGAVIVCIVLLTLLYDSVSKINVQSNTTLWWLIVVLGITGIVLGNLALQYHSQTNLVYVIGQFFSNFATLF